jgi:hypothetical protein
MRTRGYWLGTLALLLAGCQGTGGSMALKENAGTTWETGLEGTMRRGPVQPVCAPDKPCDGPLATGFTVARQGRIISRFESDTAGHFLVHLAPGAYTIVPDASAPLMNPESQARDVTVNPGGLTRVDLDFDTGIR